MGKIKDVEAKENYCIFINLENGSSIKLNLESRIQTIRFGLLEDKEFFKNVNTDGYYIRWGNQIEISVNEVFLLLQR